MSTARTLSFYESCQRKGYFSPFEPHRMDSKAMLSQAIKSSLRAVSASGYPYGELAGDKVMELGQNRGLETEHHNLYDIVVHNAALADILVSAIRKPKDDPWLDPDPLQNWTTDCLLSPDGESLRRVVLVSHWNNQRHYSECRAWYSLGEIAHYKLPMTLIVLVIGQEIDGRRRGPFTQGFLHPANRQLRFRKKSRSTSEVFNDKWEKIYREDHAEIDRQTWLQSMLTDDVLPDVCFTVDIPVPEKIHRQRILDIAKRKLERIYEMKEKPEANLSSCDWPSPCPFRRLCHVLPEQEPSEKNGFVRI